MTALTERALSDDFAALVERLEENDLASLLEDPPAMAVAMIVRQETLDKLKSLPLSAVPESERAALRTRVEQLLLRDAETIKLLQELRLEIGEQLHKLVSGRAAARSYGGYGAASSGLVNRTG